MIEWKENVERRGFVEADRYHKLIEEDQIMYEPIIGEPTIQLPRHTSI